MFKRAIRICFFRRIKYDILIVCIKKETLESNEVNEHKQDNSVREFLIID